MKKCIWLVGVLLFVGWAAFADDPVDLFSHTEDDDWMFDTDSVQDNWIISKELISRLGLSPDDKSNVNGPGLVVQGEDGYMYDWACILKKHMDWVERQK